MQYLKHTAFCLYTAYSPQCNIYLNIQKLNNKIMKTPLKTLLKEFELKNESDYFEMIINSITTGQRERAKNQFKIMKKQDQKTFLKVCVFNSELRFINFFINLL